MSCTQDYLAESGFAGLPVELRRVAIRGKQGLGRSARHSNDYRVPILSLVVWILKREVRAIGGCLGIHRR